MTPKKLTEVILILLAAYCAAEGIVKFSEALPYINLSRLISSTHYYFSQSFVLLLLSWGIFHFSKNYLPAQFYISKSPVQLDNVIMKTWYSTASIVAGFVLLVWISPVLISSLLTSILVPTAGIGTTEKDTGVFLHSYHIQQGITGIVKLIIASVFILKAKWVAHSLYEVIHWRKNSH